jgi:hypothetical protein
MYLLFNLRQVNTHFIVFSIQILFSQERYAFLDEQVTFFVPNGTIRGLPDNEFASKEEYISYYANNKMSIYTTIVNADTFSNMTEVDILYSGFSRELLDLLENDNFNQHNLLELLTLDDDSIVYHFE